RRESLARALSVSAGELERWVRDPASEEELARSRENLKGRVVLAMESTSARMSHLGTSVLSGLPILSVDQLLERIDAVELVDLQELAGWLFAPERMSVAGVGPDEREFLRAIDPLGPLLDGEDGHDAAAEAGAARR